MLYHVCFEYQLVGPMSSQLDPLSFRCVFWHSFKRVEGGKAQKIIGTNGYEAEFPPYGKRHQKLRVMQSHKPRFPFGG